MNELTNSFDRQKREEEWTQEMEKVVKAKELKCIICLNAACSCIPAAGMDQPYDVGSGV